MERLLPKTANSFLYHKEYNIVDEVYEEDFDAQFIRLPPKFSKVKSFVSVWFN